MVCTMAYDKENDSNLDENVALGEYGIQIRRVIGLGNVVLPAAVAAPAFADVYTAGATVPTFPFIPHGAPESLEVQFTNAADTAAGTGARTVMVNGLDGNYNEISATAAANGGTVSLPGSWQAVNQAFITGAGSGLVNAGQINIRVAGGGTIRAIIPAGAGITQQSQYTVPDGHTLLVKSVELEINSSAGGGGGTVKGADCNFYFGSPAAANPFFRLPRKMSCTDIQPYALDATTTIPVAARTTFGLRCSYASAALTLTGAWEGQLFRRVL
jgi:hypothetical protein